MLTLPSPAKLNLFLKVVKRRNDGYHELASLFQAIDLADTLTFEKVDGPDTLTCNHSKVPRDRSNLILKAAELFREKTGATFGIKVHLQKRIPIEAGLGGGSSNAATTLWAMNLLDGAEVMGQDLAKWSAEIGADVPFFFTRGTAYCTGIGEVTRSLYQPARKGIWVVKPDVGLSTPEVYKALSIESLPLQDPVDALEAFLKEEPIYFNDLEIPAFALKPELAEIKRRLDQQGYESVVMTGSGTTFFCMGEQEPQLPGAFIRRVSYCQRPIGGWY